MPSKRPPDDLAVRLELRWLPDRKVWSIVGRSGTTVVKDEANTRIEIERASIHLLVAAVRRELEGWLPFCPSYPTAGSSWHRDTTESQVGAPWHDA